MIPREGADPTIQLLTVLHVQFISLGNTVFLQLWQTHPKEVNLYMTRGGRKHQVSSTTFFPPQIFRGNVSKSCYPRAIIGVSTIYYMGFSGKPHFYGPPRPISHTLLTCKPIPTYLWASPGIYISHNMVSPGYQHIYMFKHTITFEINVYSYIYLDQGYLRCSHESSD